MKKLTIILAIAMIASVGNAAQIDIMVNGQDWTGEDVHPSDTVKVTWVNDIAGVYGGGFGAFQISVSNGDLYEDTGWVNTAALPITAGITLTGTDPGFNVYLTGGTYMEVPLGDMASFEFHVPDYKVDSDIIVIDPYSGAWNNVYADIGQDSFPYVELHVTPEPTTIALLGIGALSLLRRRRKA